MSKPRDPVLAVLKYFQEAELPLARQALSLAQQLVRARAETLRPRPVAKKAPAAPVAASRE